MAISIDINDAEEVLLAAFRSRCTKNDRLSSQIKAIINGTHKTYKYILVNGLLAKATRNEVNPLALQAGSKLVGAFDARSLCHKVLVPFERNFLQNALGGSNEPFLNKPARFPELSNTNAVRKGKDKETLLSIIDIFQNVLSSEDALAYLACALEFLEEKIKKLKLLDNSKISYNPTIIEVYEFILKFISKSFEGETSVIVIATLEKLFYTQLTDNYKVIVHKVNQSGSSSKEIGDIDVYYNDLIYCAIEVKDKTFTSFDIDHAFRKMVENSCQKGQFIYGINASFKVQEIENKLKEYESKRFFTYFESILQYSRIVLFKINISNKQKFVELLIESAKEINAKQATREWIQQVLKELSWKH